MFITLALLHCFHHRLENCDNAGYIQINKNRIVYMEPEVYKRVDKDIEIGCRVYLSFKYNNSNNILVEQYCQEIE